MEICERNRGYSLASSGIVGQGLPIYDGHTGDRKIICTGEWNRSIWSGGVIGEQNMDIIQYWRMHHSFFAAVVVVVDVVILWPPIQRRCS